MCDSRGAGRRTVAFQSPPECFAPRCLVRAVAVTIMTKESGPQPHQTEPAADTDHGHRRGVAGIYNRATYAAEKAVALQRWADHVEKVVAGKAAVAVPLRRGA